MPAKKTAPLPVLIGLAEMVDLFPVARQTVYRWRTERAGTGVVLPEPMLTVSRTPLWTEAQVLEFAEARHLTVDPDVLEHIRAQQAQS